MPQHVQIEKHGTLAPSPVMGTEAILVISRDFISPADTSDDFVKLAFAKSAQ